MEIKFASDIALLKLQEKFDISNKIQTIPMKYEQFKITENLDATIAGYGQACSSCVTDQDLMNIFLYTCIPLRHPDKNTIVCVPTHSLTLIQIFIQNENENKSTLMFEEEDVFEESQRFF